MEDAFLGRDYPDRQVKAAAAQWPDPHFAAAENVAGLLAKDYLVGWWQGATEFGPQALGHRNILCLPRHPKMKDYLNREVKHREMFRPFAPIVPEER